MSALPPDQPRWRWVQVEDFQHPHHAEWDLIQWDIEMELVWGPREISIPIFEGGHEWRYMKTKDAPGLSHLPRMIVLFRIAQEPTDTELGVIEGWEVWSDDDLI